MEPPEWVPHLPPSIHFPHFSTSNLKFKSNHPMPKPSIIPTAHGIKSKLLKTAGKKSYRPGPCWPLAPSSSPTSYTQHHQASRTAGRLFTVSATREAHGPAEPLAILPSFTFRHLQKIHSLPRTLTLSHRTFLCLTDSFFMFQQILPGSSSCHP